MTKNRLLSRTFSRALSFKQGVESSRKFSFPESLGHGHANVGSHTLKIGRSSRVCDRSCNVNRVQVHNIEFENNWQCVIKQLAINFKVLSVSYCRAFAHKLIQKFPWKSSFIFYLIQKQPFLNMQIYVCSIFTNWEIVFLTSPKDKVIECNHSNL